MNTIEPRERRGFTLILVMLLVVITMGLSIVMIKESRDQATVRGSYQLQQNFQMAARAALAEARASLADHWVAGDLWDAPSERGDWRFGELLASAGAESPNGYGRLMTSGVYSTNQDLMTLNYNVYVRNNPDDPAWALANTSGQGSNAITTDWDLDGRIVLTVEVYDQDPNFPLAVESVEVGATGVEVVSYGRDASNQGGLNDTLGRGTGSLGERETLDSLDGLRGNGG